MRERGLLGTVDIGYLPSLVSGRAEAVDGGRERGASFSLPSVCMWWSLSLRGTGFWSGALKPLDRCGRESTAHYGLTDTFLNSFQHTMSGFRMG